MKHKLFLTLASILPSTSLNSMCVNNVMIKKTECMNRCPMFRCRNKHLISYWNFKFKGKSVPVF